MRLFLISTDMSIYPTVALYSKVVSIGNPHAL